MKRLLLCLLLALPAVPAWAATGPDALLRDLSSPAERVRERAMDRLRETDDLPDDVVRRALDAAGVRARALLYEVIASRRMQGLAAEVAEGLRHADPVVWEAAARAVVALGDEPVAAALDALDAAEIALALLPTVPPLAEDRVEEQPADERIVGVRYTLKMRTGRNIGGIVRVRGVFERRVRGVWEECDPEDKGAGVRLWFPKQQDGYIFHPIIQIKKLVELGPVTADESASIHRARRAARKRADGERAELTRKRDEAARRQAEAEAAENAGEAGELPAAGQPKAEKPNTGADKTDSADGPDGASPEMKALNAARAARLRALHAQATIERELLARWMRKGGNYDGRFAKLSEHGWPVQPVLLAMLLDVPLEDRFVVLPETESEVLRVVQKMEALDALAESPRRGYRTFIALPVEVDEEEMFDLAAQALADVADIDVMGDILDQLAQTLDRADAKAGWQLRPAERGYAEALEEILANHGRPERLKWRIERLAMEARSQKQWADRAGPRHQSDALQHYATDLNRLARAVYRLRQWDRAAAIYAEAMEIVKRIAGRPAPVTAYNRACALSMGGRTKEALDQLDAALAIQESESDLTRDWVEEDGDLRSLRNDPRWPVILERHFGENASKSKLPPGGKGPTGPPYGER